MKTLVLSMISIAATVAAMTACTSESDPINEVVNPKDAKVEIKLNAGVSSISTKAAIESDASGNPSSNVEHVFLYKQEGNTEPTWGSANLGNAIGVTINNDGKIDFGANTQYYPVDGKNVYFIGYHTGSTTAETPATGNKIPVTITGVEDVLYANSINAGKRGDVTAVPKMKFKHLLTQIKFTLQKDANVTGDISVTSIKITQASEAGLNTTFNMSLADGALSDWAGTTSEIVVTNVPTGNLTTNASSSTDGVLLQPEATSITIEVTSASFPDSKLTTKINGVTAGVFKAGTSYTIALTVKDKSVSGSASIEQWKDENGSGEL